MPKEELHRNLNVMLKKQITDACFAGSPESYASEDERRRAKKEKKRLKREKKAARERERQKAPSYSPEREVYPARRYPPAYYQHDPRDASPAGPGSYRWDTSLTKVTSRSSSQVLGRHFNVGQGRSSHVIVHIAC